MRVDDVLWSVEGGSVVLVEGDVVVVDGGSEGEDR